MEHCHFYFLVFKLRVIFLANFEDLLFQIFYFLVFFVEKSLVFCFLSFVLSKYGINFFVFNVKETFEIIYFLLKKVRLILSNFF